MRFITKTTLIALGMAIGSTQLARAQDEAAETPEAAPPADVGSDSSPGFARVTDSEETIYAVQQKAYLIKDKVEISIMFSALFNDRFVQSYAPVASVTYHVAENLGLEAFGGYFFPGESGALNEIFDQANLRPQFATQTQLLWAAGLGVQWSPIYGKLEIAGRQLGNFNFYLTTGVAVGETRVECTANFRIDPRFDGGENGTPAVCPDGERPVYEPNTFRPMAVFGGGFRFYFNETIGLKAEVRDYLFASSVFRPPREGDSGPLGETSAPLQYSDAIRNNIYANVGVSILF
ncbi:MAG: outer membrane beta-barrel domain-containing protein [Myxococcota bacterium]